MNKAQEFVKKINEDSDSLGRELEINNIDVILKKLVAICSIRSHNSKGKLKEDWDKNAELIRDLIGELPVTHW